METFRELISFWPHPELLPFIGVIGAIIFLMLARIAPFSVITAFLFSVAFLVVSWAITFFLPMEHSDPIAGIANSPLSIVSLQILFPAFLVILGLVFQKSMNDLNKLDAALLLMISLLGGMAVLCSTNWMMFFVGIQCMSLPIFVLLAFNTDEQNHVTASVHYLILSSIAMGMLLLVIALIYSQTGSLDFVSQKDSLLLPSPSSQKILSLGLALILCGLGFKLSLFPFHFWAPTVYQKASVFVVGYLLVIMKSIIIFFILANVWLIFAWDNGLVVTVLSAMALFSMWIGTILIFNEKKTMRFLAFLSIGHLGFLFIPMLSNHELAHVAVVTDIFAFAIATLMLIAIQISKPSHNFFENLEDLRGLWHKSKSAALIMTISLASLAGIPLTAGFIAKYTIFMTGVLTEQWGLLINMALTSIVTIFVLVRVIISLYSTPKLEQLTLAPRRLWPHMLLTVGALVLLFIGIIPQGFLGWIQNSITQPSYEDSITMKHR
jgi:NADH-quinone oxidoreductase subunit N